MAEPLHYRILGVGAPFKVIVYQPATYHEREEILDTKEVATIPIAYLWTQEMYPGSVEDMD